MKLQFELKKKKTPKSDCISCNNSIKASKMVLAPWGPIMLSILLGAPEGTQAQIYMKGGVYKCKLKYIKTCFRTCYNV